MCFFFAYSIVLFLFLMIRRPPRSTRTDTLFPYTTLFRSLPSSLNRSSRLSAQGCLVLTPMDPGVKPRDDSGVCVAVVRHPDSNPVKRRGRAAVRPWLPSRRQRGQAHRSPRSEEHTSELQSLMRISYDVFCLKKTKKK